jgi:signal transduction histidine kinase
MITEEQLAEECRRLKDENRRLQEDYEYISNLFENMGLGYEDALMLYDKAKESSNLKTDFIKQVSHEIRTPLNILSGFAQILTSGMELDEATRLEVTQGIVDNTKRITNLVNKMLELAEAGSDTVIEREDDALAVQIAAQAVDESRITLASHLDFDLRLSPEAETAMLHTNLQQATRALVLLLDNAMKFTAPAEAAGGSAAAKEKASVVLAVDVTKGDDGRKVLTFAVEDTGIGVPPEEAEHIFDEFVQLDQYYDGTGIGLTVARSIARRLQGDLVLDTDYAPGARFVYTLPME